MRPTLTALILLTLAGCNTIYGAGRDIETAGSAIQRESYQARTGR